jgi:hypothetical protein
MKAKQLKLIRDGMVFEKTKNLREAIVSEGKLGITRTTNGPEVARGATKLKERSELNIQFRSPSASLVGDDDALLSIVVPSSGFTDRRRPGLQQKPEVKSGVKVATVRIDGLVADPPKEGEVKELPGIAGGIPVPKTPEPPTAKINVPDLVHGSQFSARNLAHVQIQEWIERYLPEVEIQGPKKYVESRLAVKNDTDEPLTVWVKAYHRQSREGRLQWTWFPQASGGEGAYRFIVKPGEKKLLDLSESLGESEIASSKKPGLLAAARVRLWAESESGERWMEYKTKDLQIVRADPALGGEPGYFDESMRTHTHVVRPKKGPRPYSERVLKLANKTSEPLTIELEYRSAEGGLPRWRKLDPFEIPSGAFGHPTTAEGMKVRASQIRVVGKGENFYFGEYEKQPLDVVEPIDGRRLYSADKIGAFDFTFRPPEKKK